MQIDNVQELSPGPTDRAFFVGMSGSGKTTLARVLLQHVESVLIADPKDDTYWPEYRRYTNLRKLVADRPPRAIYSPSLKEQRAEPDCWDKFYHYALLRKNVTVYTDEVLLICPSANVFPFYYRAVQTSGRSKGVRGWSGTQRPAGIPRVLMSEAETIFCFRLEDEDDRARMSKRIGVPEEEIQALKKREFFHKNLDGLSPRLSLDLR